MNGVPILHNALDQLARAGVERTTVVVGYFGDQVRVSAGARIGQMQVRYVFNSRYATTGTGQSLLLGLRDVTGDVLVLEGDVFFGRLLLKRFLEEPYRDATLIEPWTSALDGSVVECVDGFVSRWWHKSARPPGFRLDGTYKTVNLHRFSGAFVGEHLRPSLESAAAPHDEPLEFALARVVEANGRIRGVEARDPWVEIDDEHDLRTAEAVFGEVNGSR